MAIDPERHARTIAALRDSRLDAVIAGSQTQVLLLTGYWPVMGASIALFTADGDVRLIVPEDEVELVAKTSSVHSTPYKPASLHCLASSTQALKDQLRSVLAKLRISGARIGIELTRAVQPASYAVSTEYRSSLIELLQDLLAESTCVGCDEMFELMKATKTAKELERMQKACCVASDGFLKVQTSIQAGLRETEIASAGQSAFERAPLASDFERSYGYFFCMSGPNSAKASSAYARTRQRVVEAGDLVMIHANTCGDGYWTDITRTYTAGKPSPRQNDIRASITEARKAGLRAIQPGVTGHDVDEAARSVMKSHGFGEAFRHASGHGVGFAAANPEGRPRIHPLSRDVLEVGMTFNLEPAAYFDDYGGMRHCDLVEVTNDGARVMTDF
jgi:Xaa-Pro aminopeptidase